MTAYGNRVTLPKFSHVEPSETAQLSSIQDMSLHSLTQNGFPAHRNLHLNPVNSIPCHMFQSSTAEEQTTPKISGLKLLIKTIIMIPHDSVSWLQPKMAAGLPGGLPLQQGDWTLYMMAGSKGRGRGSCQPS